MRLEEHRYQTSLAMVELHAVELDNELKLDNELELDNEQALYHLLIQFLCLPSRCFLFTSVISS